MLDLRQTQEYAKYMKGIGWIVDGKPESFAYIKKIPFLGSFIKIQRPEKLDNKIIEHLIKKYRPFQFVIEPKNTMHHTLLTKHRFRQSKSYFVPSKTIQVDLVKSEKQLLKEMHYKTRYNIGLGKRLKLNVEKTKDIKTFAKFWQECALKQRGMFLNQKDEIEKIHKAFGNYAYIILIKRGKAILSGILLICTKDMAYYMHAASTTEGKKLFAPTLNAWEAIKLAKKLKKKVFDFEGVYDERFPIKTWKGFTRFKKSFGGTEIEYPGTFTKFRLPI